ncbi:MAG: ferritin-like domain-containing protein [Solirubrobacteraceae bacterium]
MIGPRGLAPLTPQDTQTLENVLADTRLPDSTRRHFLGRAAATTAVVVALGPLEQADAATSTDTPATVLNTAITAEALAVTFLSGLLAGQPAESVAKFVPILQAANQAEFDHYQTLSSLGATALATNFWVPDAFFEPANIFPTLEIAETLFVNAYLIGATVFANSASATNARYAAEIAGVEAQHRALVRFAQNKLPNDVAFESYRLHSMSAIVAALKSVGVGFGSRGSKPGKYYPFAPPTSSSLAQIASESPT